MASNKAWPGNPTEVASASEKGVTIVTEPLSSTTVLEGLFAGGGKMGALMRSHDWSKTPLGPVEQWPQSLRTTVSIILNSQYPMFTLWGPHLVKLYNDAYRPVLGADKHPAALGKCAPEIWAEIWDDIGPLVNQVFTKGEATWADNLQLFIVRSGYIEETYFTFSYSPIRDETGGIGGLFCTCTETTEQVLGDRRLRILRNLAAQAGQAKKTEAACQAAMQTLASNPEDVPFALLYLLDASGNQAHLAGITGLKPDTAASPKTIALADAVDDFGWLVAKVARTASPEQIENIAARLGAIGVGPWEESPHTALIIPVSSPEQKHPLGVLVAGISARRALDGAYQEFWELVATQVASTIANTRTYEAEHQRIAELVQLDRAKTASARAKSSLNMAKIQQEAALREQMLRLRAEQAQRETQATYQRLIQLLEMMSDAFIELDKNWRITYQNAAAERINGNKPRSQVLGKTLWEEWPASAGTEFEYQYRKAMAEQVPVHFEYCYYAPPEFDIWLEVHAYPSPESLGIFFRDISDRKRLEADLRERERLFSTLAEASPVSIFRFDAASNCVYINDRWTTLTGRAVESGLGMGWVEALYPDDRDRLAREWLQWCQDADKVGLYQNEGRCLRSDGSVVWFYIQALMEVDANGETVGYIGVLTDITNLKQTEAALQESQAQLQQQLAEIEAIYQSAPIGLDVLDTDLKFVRINQRLAEINGLSVQAHLGRTIREVIPDLADAAEQLLRPILETGEPLLNVEITGETPAQPGVQRTWLEHFIPLKNGDCVIGISTVCEEITDRKRLEAERQQVEAELRQAKAELEIRVAERTAELRQSNAELQQSELTLRSFFNSGGMMMAIVELHNQDIQFVSTNYAMAEFLGTTPEVLQNRFDSSLAEFQAVLLPLREYYQEAQLSQAPVRFEYCYDKENSCWLFVSICPITMSSTGHPRFSFIAKDVTDRKCIEESLAQHEEQLRLTLEFTNIGTWDWDVKTGNILWNDNHFRLLGLEPETAPALYQVWRDAIHPDDLERVEQALLKALAEHTDYEAEYRVIHPDGTLHWLIGKGRGIYNEAGEPLRMLGVILDVSDRKWIEEALQASETRYRGIIQDQTELIARFSPDSTVLFVNDAYCRYFGIKSDEILGKSYNPVIYEADRERVTQLVQMMNAANPTLTIENRVIDSQGRIRWTQWINRLLLDPQGKIRELQAVGRDITELKQAEQALRSSEERLQLALEASGDGIWDWNIVTNEIYYSPQYFQMLGYEAEELPHSVNTWHELVHPEDMVWVSDLLARHFQDSSVRYEFDYRLRTKGGDWKWVADYGKVVARDEQGHPLRMIGTHRDVTDRKHAEEHIAASLKEKEVLLKEIHHRVKNNLGIVSGLLQMQIRRTKDPEATMILQDSQNRIASIALVHEKLYRSSDLANIDFAQYLQDLTIYLFDSYNISSSKITLDIQVEQVNLEIETAIPCGLIVNELVSNALKHAFPDSRVGEIQVRLSAGDSATGGQPDRPFVLIVRDNGIGLPTDFDPEKTTTLGISLVQGLVAQIQGIFEINSQQGTEIRVTFGGSSSWPHQDLHPMPVR